MVAQHAPSTPPAEPASELERWFRTLPAEERDAMDAQAAEEASVANDIDAQTAAAEAASCLHAVIAEAIHRGDRAALDALLAAIRGTVSAERAFALCDARSR